MAFLMSHTGSLRPLCKMALEQIMVRKKTPTSKDQQKPIYKPALILRYLVRMVRVYIYIYIFVSYVFLRIPILQNHAPSTLLSIFVKHCCSTCLSNMGFIWFYMFVDSICCMLSGPGVPPCSDSASPDQGPKVPVVGSPAR